MPPERYLFVDTETTGLTPGFHEIIEIGCVLSETHRDLFGNEEFVEVGSRVWRMHPKYPERAQPGALRVNGYGVRDWSDAVPREHAFRELVKFGAGSVFIAQNVTFDWNFLSEDAKHLGIPLADNVFPRKLDLMSMAFIYSRVIDPTLDRFNLAAMCEHFGITNTAAHEALSDARAAFAVFKRIIKR